MNSWTRKSIELANQRNYLDLLYKVYPMSINLRREIDEETSYAIEKAYQNRNNKELLKLLLQQEVFPIKDSYVAYLKRDTSAVDRNPNTVERLTGMLYEMGLDEIFEKATAPKETNRQLGPMFKDWLDKGTLGCKVTRNEDEFLNYEGNIILNSSDMAMKEFASKYLGYKRNKGLDFIGKFNNTIVIAEAKFLSDFGGHQNAQFDDAISTMKSEINPFYKNYHIKQISILDGVLYIKSKNKMHTRICSEFTNDEVIISSVLLRDYLYSL